MGKISDKIFSDLMGMLDEIESTVMRYNNDLVKITPKRNTGKIREFSNRAETKVVEMAKEKKKIYTEKRRELANKVSEMARTANKRLDRLEKNGLEKHSAYMAWQKDGKIRFSVKGKSYQQLQREYWRVKKFLDSETSTIKGAKRNMKKIATDIMGLKAEKVNNMSLENLKNSTKNFFKIKDAIEEKYRDIGQTAKAIDYQKLMNEIAEYMKYTGDDLTAIDGDFNPNFIEATADRIMQYMEMENELDKMIGW